MLECRTCADGGIAVEIGGVAVVGVVAAETGGFAAVDATDLIENAFRECIGDCLRRRQHPCGQAREVAEVEHVRIALFAGVAAVVFGLRSCAAESREECGIFGGERKHLFAKHLVRFQQSGHCREIGQRER